jgi:hypothetical protein
MGASPNPTSGASTENRIQLGHHVTAINEHADAVGKLRKSAQAAEQPQFDGLYRIAEAAPIQVEQARIDYERHASEHGC